MLKDLTTVEKGFIILIIYGLLFITIFIISLIIMYKNIRYNLRCREKGICRVVGFKKEVKTVGIIKETEKRIYYPILKIKGVKEKVCTKNTFCLNKDMVVGKDYVIHYNKKRPKLFYIEGSMKGFNIKKFSLAIFLIILDFLSVLVCLVGYTTLAKYSETLDDLSIENLINHFGIFQ